MCRLVDELADLHYLLVDRIEGRAHYVAISKGDAVEPMPKNALIERSRDFTLVPWRPVLEPRVGQAVSGIMRESGIDWNFGRQRGPGVM